jgi:hypothetical protein
VRLCRLRTRRTAPRASSEGNAEEAHIDRIALTEAQLGALSPEAQAEVKKLAAAEARVAAARAALDEFERLVAADSEVNQAQLAAERGADADVARAQAEFDAAAAALVTASAARKAAQDAYDAAGNPFLSILGGNSAEVVPQEKWAAPDIDDTAERLESGKAAAIGAFTALVVSLPLLLASSAETSTESELVSAGAVTLSGVLAAVVYRYAIRRDGNSHLKGGVLAAFGLTRGLAQADSFLARSEDIGVVELLQAALLTGEAVITFAFVCAAVEAAMRANLVSPFPKK